MIIAVGGLKGGAGKTTVAVNLASEILSRKKNVLLVDADPQRTALQWHQDAVDAGLPAPTTIAMGRTMHERGQLDQISKGYDLVVIDCPPRLGDVQRSALMAAEFAILPCGQSPPEIRALEQTVAVLDEARTVRPGLGAAILLTRTQPRTKLGTAIRDALAPSGLPILQTELGFRVAYQEAMGAGAGVAQYAPQDPAAAEVRALCDELRTVLAAQKGRKNA